MSKFTAFTIEFENKNTAFALKDVPKDADSVDILEALNLPEFTGVVTLVVAAGRMPAEITDATRELFTKALAPVAEKHRLLIVDGATAVGGVLAMGDAREAIGGTFPLVGVIPIGVITIPDDLHSAHSHFVFVDGANFTDESLILPGFLNATSKPGVVIVVNCRLESIYLSSEFPHHAKWADAMIPIRNSGGVADALLDPDSELVKTLPPDTIIRGVDLDKPEDLVALLEEIFAHA